MQVEGNAADQIQVGGNATINGGIVVASLIGYSPMLGHAYPILTTTTGTVTGAFDSVSTYNLPFLQASLSKDSDTNTHESSSR